MACSRQVLIRTILAVQGVDIIHEYHVAAPAAGLSQNRSAKADWSGNRLLSDMKTCAAPVKAPRRKIAFIDANAPLSPPCGLMLSRAEKCDISGKTQRRAYKAFCRFHAQSSINPII